MTTKYNSNQHGPDCNTNNNTNTWCHLNAVPPIVTATTTTTTITTAVSHCGATATPLPQAGTTTTATTATAPLSTTTLIEEEEEDTCSPQWIGVLDHASSKLLIPCAAVQRTRALLRTHPTPALCRLFMEGRCRQGSRCHQVHADEGVVLDLRREALAYPACCDHHDYNHHHHHHDVSVMREEKNNETGCGGGGGGARAAADDDNDSGSSNILIAIHWDRDSGGAQKQDLMASSSSAACTIDEEKRQTTTLLSKTHGGGILGDGSPSTASRLTVPCSRFQRTKGLEQLLLVTTTTTTTTSHSETKPPQQQQRNVSMEEDGSPSTAGRGSTTVVDVDRSQLCRSHDSQGEPSSPPSMCRYGDECNFLHLCRQVHRPQLISNNTAAQRPRSFQLRQRQQEQQQPQQEQDDAPYSSGHFQHCYMASTSSPSPPPDCWYPTSSGGHDRRRHRSGGAVFFREPQQSCCAVVGSNIMHYDYSSHRSSDGLPPPAPLGEINSWSYQQGQGHEWWSHNPYHRQ